MKKLTLLLLSILSLSSCVKKEETENPEIKQEIVQTNSQLNKTLDEQEDIKQQIVALSRKKDSLLNVLKSTKESMTRMNDSKIDKGIQGVNLKLNELKGQKENIEEQVALQKQEMVLATKKIDLLNQEKVVYDAQHKALYDKGAAPKEFAKIDTLLGAINGKINEQKRKVKALTRNITDVEDQVISIVDQRDFLSKKIREDYNAQEIFSEFAQEEELKLNAQIKIIDTQISSLTGTVNTINTSVASLNDSITVKTVQHDAAIQTQEEAEKTKSRMYYALFAIVAIIALFAAFYFIGKKKKQQLKNTK
jgi:septal ring factor EnvC (AmiA/AmiB activator)